jgi:hypothetical protein
MRWSGSILRSDRTGWHFALRVWILALWSSLRDCEGDVWLEKDEAPSRSPSWLEQNDFVPVYRQDSDCPDPIGCREAAITTTTLHLKKRGNPFVTGQKNSAITLSIGLLLVMIFACSSTGSACTSFAAYSTQNLYGMNFDYGSVELRFSIIRYNDRKIFQAFFIEGGDLYPFCGVNSSGLFSSIQMLSPQPTSWPPPGPNQINLG